MNVQEVLQYRLFTISGTPINVATVCVAFLIAVISFWVSRLAEKGTIRFLGKRGVKDEGSASATARLIYYLVLATGLAMALHSIGINLTALFAAGAFFAIALGFAMQNITQNFVSGLILLVERTIKPGDVLEVEGTMVRVTTLGMRATVTRTLDAEDVIIPNSILVSSSVKNFTLRDKLYRVRTIVGVTYDSDMRLVREVLTKVTTDLGWRDSSMTPVILMQEFGSSSVNFDVSVWIDEPFSRASRLSALNEAIWFALKDAGIVIAFPQVDVHFDRPVVDALGRLAGRSPE